VDPSDQHIVSRHVVSDGASGFSLRNEGFFRAHVGSGKIFETKGKNRMMGRFSWYDVPFGVMVPATSSQARNLLVPVCISSSAVAYTSARIENMFMDLGSAAGVAVSYLLQATPRPRSSKKACPDLTVQDDVNITAIQEILSGVYKQKFHGLDAQSTPIAVLRS
jgi:FAD dependent oxidoreductase